MLSIRRQSFSFLLLALLLAACAGIATPKTFDQSLAYTYGANTAALEAATSSLSAKTITSADMEKVLTLHDKVKTLLDASRAAHNVGDIKTAQGQLELATAALTELQTYLRSKGVQ